MQNNKPIFLMALVAVVIAIGAFMYAASHGASLSAGSTGTRFPDGISADTTSPTTGQVRGTTLDITGLYTADGGILHSSALSTTTTASMTLASSDLSGHETVVDLPGTSNGSSITITLPASSSLSAFVPTAGDWSEQCWVNATTTTATSIVFAGGTGTNLLVASSSATALGSKTLLNGKEGCFRFTRIGSGNNASDINATLTVYQ